MAVWFDWFNDDRYLIDSVSISAANGRSFMLVGLCFGCSVVRFHLVIGAGAFSDVYCHLLVGSFSWKWIIQSNFGLTAFGFFLGYYLVLMGLNNSAFWPFCGHVAAFGLWILNGVGCLIDDLIWKFNWFWIEIGLVRLGLGRVSVESVSVWLDLSILGDLLRFWADWVEIWLNLSKFGQFFVKFGWTCQSLVNFSWNLVENLADWVEIWLNLLKFGQFFVKFGWTCQSLVNFSWNLVENLVDWVEIWLNLSKFGRFLMKFGWIFEQTKLEFGWTFRNWVVFFCCEIWLEFWQIGSKFDWNLVVFNPVGLGPIFWRFGRTCFN